MDGHGTGREADHPCMHERVTSSTQRASCTERACIACMHACLAAGSGQPRARCRTEGTYRHRSQLGAIVLLHICHASLNLTDGKREAGLAPHLLRTSRLVSCTCPPAPYLTRYLFCADPVFDSSCMQMQRRARPGHTYAPPCRLLALGTRHVPPISARSGLLAWPALIGEDNGAALSSCSARGGCALWEREITGRQQRLGGAKCRVGGRQRGR